MTAILTLDGTASMPAAAAAMAGVLGSLDAAALARYPDAAPLEASIAERFGVDPGQVLVTAGGDDALDRCCRAALAPGSLALLPSPTFDMLDRFIRLAGGDIRRVAWPDGDFPTSALLAALEPAVRLVFLVSPNNPTGCVLREHDLVAVAAAAPDALVVLDHAYVEYADADLTAAALRLPNVVVVRTLSKAWGLPACRVGMALGSAEVIGRLRAAGGPYPVSAPALAVAAAVLRNGEGTMRTHVARVREERTRLTALLRDLGVTTPRSEGSFVALPLGARAPLVDGILRSRGVAVRRFAAPSRSAGLLRITLPGEASAFAQLADALRVALKPDALLLDMDGVLADVSHSYQAAIRGTARAYGVTLTREDIGRATLGGDANNDWVLTQRLLAAHDVPLPFDEVRDRFQALYLGEGDHAGLREREDLLVPRAILSALAERMPLGVVTGRPRAEADWFLERAGIRDLVSCVVAQEDGPQKPDPAPVQKALAQLGARRAWMVGDTPDDVRAAAAAGVVPLGVVAPGTDVADARRALIGAGAALVLDQLADLLEAD